MKRRADFGHYVSVLAEVMETTENMGAKLNPFLKRSGKLLTKEKTFHLKIMTRQKQSLKTALNCTRITSKIAGTGSSDCDYRGAQETCRGVSSFL